MKMKYVPPYPVRKFFSGMIWESSVDKVLLTFDDGPIPENTEAILAKLDEIQAKAIFFCVGNNIEKYPDLTEQILTRGHLIGNHTFNHKNVTEKDFNPRVEIFDTNAKLFNKYKYEVKYFRPPHGRFNLKTQKLAASFGMTNVMWTLLTYDFKNDMKEIRHSVSNYLKKNSIVVLHDSLKSKKIIIDSIDYIAEQAEKKGFTIGTPQECLR